MDSVTVAGIIISAAGAVIYMLWHISQKSSDRERQSADRMRSEDREMMLKTLSKIEASIDRQSDAYTDLSDAINKLSNLFEKQNLTIQVLERDMMQRFKDANKAITQALDAIETLRIRDIEGLRRRDHAIINKVTALDLQAKLHGWKIEKLDEIPPMPDLVAKTEGKLEET